MTIGLPPLVHLERVTSSSSSSVTLPASGTIAGHAKFPAGARHVVVVWNACTNAGSTEDYALVRVNGDTGSNYDMQRTDAFGTTIAAFKETGIVGWSQIASMGGGDSTNFKTPGWMLFPYAFNTANFTSFTGMSGTHNARVRIGTGVWENTAALTSINFSHGSNNFLGDFDLYVVDESYLVSSGEQILGSATNDFTNVSVPSQVGDISIINYTRSTRGSTNDGLALDINGDTTGSNYQTHMIYAYNTTQTQFVSTSASQGNQIGGTDAATADANHFGSSLTTVNAFNYGANDAQVNSLSGHLSVSTADAWIGTANMRRNNVAAVTSVNASRTVAGNGWAAGSGQWVYAVPKILLERKELASDTTSVTFTLSGYSIPANAHHLRLNCYMGTNDGSNQGVDLTLNSDTTAANYNLQYNYANASSSSAASSGASRTISLVPSEAATANAMGGGVIFFPNYAATDREQSYLSFCASGPQAETLLLSGRWENTAAIATITLQPGSSGFCDGSIFELEAIGDISGWTGNVMGLDDPAEVLGVEKANIEKVMGVEAG
jgi:hypothetical protein